MRLMDGGWVSGGKLSLYGGICKFCLSFGDLKKDCRGKRS
jgi:hypothetical protein